MEQPALNNVKVGKQNYFLPGTFGGQNYNLYLNVVYFYNTSAKSGNTKVFPG